MSKGVRLSFDGDDSSGRSHATPCGRSCTATMLRTWFRARRPTAAAGRPARLAALGNAGAEGREVKEGRGWMRRARPSCPAWRRNVGSVRDSSVGSRRPARAPWGCRSRAADGGDASGGRRERGGDASREPRTEARLGDAGRGTAG